MTTRVRPPVETLAAHFEEVATRHADRIAIRDPAGDVSYAELDLRARAIAGILDGLGALGPRRVGILLDQGADAVAAILGVLRAGSAYVPLDPNDPGARLRFIARDAELTALLTSGRHAAMAAEAAPGGVRIARVDDRTASGRTSDARSPRASTPSADAPAVIVYTSGSTGEPKGVVQTHRTMLHFVRNYADRLAIGPDDRHSLLYTLSFSAAAMDIYGALLRGATLCPFDIRRRGIENVAAWIRQERISVLHAVPTVFRYVAGQTSERSPLTTVRAIDLGGEPVYRSDARLARKRFGRDCLFVNHYAAAEASVIAQHVAGSRDEQGDGLLPVGLAAHGMDVVLESEGGDEAGGEQAGEIVVRSEFLSPGYWRRPELTRRAFGVDPQNPARGVYRTGDTGRRDAQGLLYVLGRRDARVKIRGNSVDLAEVEAAARSVQGVREAVVEAQRDDGPTGDPLIVAYVVAEGHDGDAAGIRRALTDRLPAYMLPSAIRVVPSFPLTPTGKVDRAALRALPPETSAEKRSAEPPADPDERRVADIFSQVLGVPSVGRHDDFFALGGTSLTLAQVQAELRRTMGTDADLGDLARSATVAEVAASVRRRRVHRESPRSSPLLVPLREGGTGSAVVLVHGWHGQAFVSPLFLDAIDREHPIYALQARGLVDGAKPHTRVDAMASDYVRAIRELSPTGRHVLVGICAGSVIAHEMACRLRDNGTPPDNLLMVDPPFPPHTFRFTRRWRDLAALYLAQWRWGPARAVATRISERLTAREDRIGGAVGELAPVQREAAVRVAIGVRVALRRHRPRIYEGPVHVLASRKRLSGKLWKSAAWRGILAGRIELVEVSDRHDGVLDPLNARFRVALQRSITSGTARSPLSHSMADRRRCGFESAGAARDACGRRA